MTLRTPDICPAGHLETRVLSTRTTKSGAIRRRHRCETCRRRWTSFQSLINPRKATVQPHQTR